MSPFEMRSTYSADTFNGLITASRVWLTPSTILRYSPWCLVASARVASFPSPAAFTSKPASGHQCGDVVDAVVEVVLDLVEVAVVAVGNLRRDVALRDAVHIFGGDVQRPDHRVQGLVHALDNLAILALVLRCIGAGGQFPFYRRLP